MTHPLPVTDDPAPARPARRWPWLLAVIVLAIAGAGAWRWWQQRQAAAHSATAGLEQRVEALELRMAGLRRELRGQSQRLQQAEATNRVLRDELLGLGQRAALLEDSVSKLADPDRHGAQALRLDEVEWLLTAAQQRLTLAGDLDGARRAYALAAGLLDGIDDPAYLSLRQTLAQERAALEAQGADPRLTAAARLDTLLATLARLPEQPDPDAAPVHAPWWQRLLGRFVEVRRSGDGLLRTPSERATAQDTLQLEFTLARAALERRDEAAWRAALARAERWLPRLWPDTPQRRAHAAELRALQALPLRPALPVLGSTLSQLRAMRAAR